MGIAHNSPKLQDWRRPGKPYKAPETLRIDPAIAMGDRLQSDIIDARKTGGGSSRKKRQFPAIAFGKMTPGRADLLLDQIEIIEKPFAGRG